jgi:hypothetical protein
MSSERKALLDLYEYHTVPYKDLTPERRIELSDIRRLIDAAEAVLNHSRVGNATVPLSDSEPLNSERSAKDQQVGSVSDSLSEASTDTAHERER